MKRWFPLAGAIALILFSGTAFASPEPVAAASSHEDDGGYVKHDEDDWEDEGRYALGIGFGLVNLDEEGLSDDVEPYFSASFRIRVGNRRPARGYSNEANRRFGMQGYLEPEIGYWESSTRTFDASDFMIGLNIVGVSPIGAADFFVGGGLGLHFVDQDITVRNVRSSISEESFGANAHFGVDVWVGRNVSLFGVGRFDIVEDRDDLEAKAYVGVRFHF